jgi:hypothetical protein
MAQEAPQAQIFGPQFSYQDSFRYDMFIRSEKSYLEAATLLGQIESTGPTPEKCKELKSAIDVPIKLYMPKDDAVGLPIFEDLYPAVRASYKAAYERARLTTSGDDYKAAVFALDLECTKIVLTQMMDAWKNRIEALGIKYSDSPMKRVWFVPSAMDYLEAHAQPTAKQLSLLIESGEVYWDEEEADLVRERYPEFA